MTLGDSSHSRTRPWSITRTEGSVPGCSRSPETELGLPGHAQLADQEHVHGRAQEVGDDARHGHSASGEAKHNHVWPPHVFDQRLGQQAAGFFAIAEHHLAKG